MNANSPSVDFNGRPVVIIKIHRSEIAKKGGVYAAVRSGWRISEARADGRAVVAAELESGEIVGVYDVFPGAWVPCPGAPHRKEFNASPATPAWARSLLGTQLSSRYRTGRNPIRYAN